jgi:hypothetical protein
LDERLLELTYLAVKGMMDGLVVGGWWLVVVVVGV